MFQFYYMELHGSLRVMSLNILIVVLHWKNTSTLLRQKAKKKT